MFFQQIYSHLNGIFAEEGQKPSQ